MRSSFLYFLLDFDSFGFGSRGMLRYLSGQRRQLEAKKAVRCAECFAKLQLHLDRDRQIWTEVLLIQQLQMAPSRFVSLYDK